jgi:parallel beta-helix repeat protein
MRLGGCEVNSDTTRQAKGGEAMTARRHEEAMTAGRNIGRIAVMTAIVALVVPLLASVAGATSGTLYVESDTTLTEDHNGNIVISADNVTLDCAGWTVIGTHVSDGIVIEGHSGVAVRNCVVQQFVYGIVVMNSSNVLLERNEVRWNGLSGIDVTAGATDVVVRQNTMHENGFDAGYSGIDVEYGSSHVVVSGNNSWGNAGNGFYAYQSSNLMFDNNDAFSNSRGFDLDLEVTDSTFSNNRAVNNAGDGVSVFSSSNDNRFIANEVGGNGGHGFQVHRSSRNVLRSNDVRWNGADGISLNTESSYNVVRENDVQWNNHTGIPVTDGSDWNLLAGNVTSHNGDSGIRIATSHNTLLGNRSNNNTNYGFLVVGSFNKLAFNSGCGNGVLDALQEGGTKGNVWLANDFCTSDI